MEINSPVRTLLRKDWAKWDAEHHTQVHVEHAQNRDVRAKAEKLATHIHRETGAATEIKHHDDKTSTIHVNTGDKKKVNQAIGRAAPSILSPGLGMTVH